VVNELTGQCTLAMCPAAGVVVAIDYPLYTDSVHGYLPQLRQASPEAVGLRVAAPVPGAVVINIHTITKLVCQASTKLCA
jgi:hypothetical protein